MIAVLFNFVFTHKLCSVLICCGSFFVSLNALGSSRLDTLVPVEHHLLAAFSYPQESSGVSDVAGLADKVCKVLDVESNSCFYSTTENRSSGLIDIEVYSAINQHLTDLIKNRRA